MSESTVSAELIAPQLEDRTKQSVTPLSYRTIRRDYQSHEAMPDVMVDSYAQLISPLLTRLFVKAGTTPNQVTVCMMISGVVGAALFAVPQVFCKVLGLVFMHLWYVLDCSDGEVARITRQFSKFGTEMDYIAHVVNHPLFNLAFAYGLICMGRYNSSLILWASLLCISAELVIRNLIGFQYMYKLKMVAGINRSGKRGVLKGAAAVLVNLFSIYPNFALAFPLVYLVDIYFGTSIAMYYLLIHASVSTLMATRASYRRIRSTINT